MDTPKRERPRLYFPEPAADRAPTATRPRLPFSETTQKKDDMAQGSRRRLFDEEETSSTVASRRLPFDNPASTTAPKDVQQHARAELFPEGKLEPRRASSDVPGMRVQPLISKAMDLAKHRYPELVEVNEPRFRRKLEQLQGWALQTVVDWGTGQAEKQANLAARVAGHTRDFSVLGAGQKLETVIRELSTPLTLYERVRGIERNVDTVSLMMAGVKQQLLAMQPTNDSLLDEQRALKSEFMLLVGTLSIASEVFGEPADLKIAQALDQRRRSLHMSAAQANSLADSLEALGALMVRQVGDIEHALNVTFTNIKLAQAMPK